MHQSVPFDHDDFDLPPDAGHALRHALRHALVREAGARRTHFRCRVEAPHHAHDNRRPIIHRFVDGAFPPFLSQSDRRVA